MDNNIVKAFRKRLKRGGFTEITIYDNCNGTYHVQCNSEQGYINRDMSEIQMLNTPHLVWFD